MPGDQALKAAGGEDKGFSVITSSQNGDFELSQKHEWKLEDVGMATASVLAVTGGDM